MLVNYNGTAITYDNIGNPLNWRNASGFVWSARELVSANLSNGNTVSYTYNADGIRTQFEEFLNGFAGMPSQKKMKLLYVSVVIQE